MLWVTTTLNIPGSIDYPVQCGKLDLTFWCLMNLSRMIVRSQSHMTYNPNETSDLSQRCVKLLLIAVQLFSSCPTKLLVKGSLYSASKDTLTVGGRMPVFSTYKNKDSMWLQCVVCICIFSKSLVLCSI